MKASDRKSFAWNCNLNRTCQAHPATLSCRWDRRSPYARTVGGGGAPWLALVSRNVRDRTKRKRRKLAVYYQRDRSPRYAAMRKEWKDLTKRIADQKPSTSVPIQKELDAAQRRKTFVHVRGNYRVQGEVSTRSPHGVSSIGRTDRSSPPSTRSSALVCPRRQSTDGSSLPIVFGKVSLGLVLFEPVKNLDRKGIGHRIRFVGLACDRNDAA